MISYFDLFEIEINIIIDSKLLESKYLIKLNQLYDDSEACLIINQAYNVLSNDIMRIEHIIQLLEDKFNIKIFNLNQNNQVLFEKYFNLNEEIENNNKEQNKIIYIEYSKYYKDILFNMQRSISLEDFNTLYVLFIELKLITNILDLTIN
ncbi:MAG: hypothetical protein U1E31_02920 [Rickettsiales bacterium]